MKKTIDPNTHAIIIPAGYRRVAKKDTIQQGDFFTTPASDEWTPTLNAASSAQNPFSPRVYIRHATRPSLRRDTGACAANSAFDAFRQAGGAFGQ